MVAGIYRVNCTSQGSFSFSVTMLIQDVRNERVCSCSLLKTDTNEALAQGLVGIYLSKVNNGNTRTLYEICSTLTIKTIQVSLLLILNRCHTLFWCHY